MLGKQEYQPELFSTVQIESLVPKGHLLRKLDETLDLSFIRPMVESLYSDGVGRPSIDPEIFVRMILIEYLYDIESDRQLCEEIGYNLAYRWFCRFSLGSKVPDHSSMTRIRDRLGEDIFKKIFVHIVKLCEQKGLVKGKRVMTDGSYMRADAALSSLVEREPKSVEAKENGDDKTDPTNGSETGASETAPSSPLETAPTAGLSGQSSNPTTVKRKSKSIKGKTFSNKTHVSKTDPDSTLAGKDNDPKKLRYKVHQSCDADSRVIVDCDVTTGSVTDGTVYIDRLKKIEETFNFKIEEAIADRGYGYGENLQYLKDKKIRSFVPRFRTDVGDKIDREKTPYNAETDQFSCELGSPLFPFPIQSDGNLAYRPKKGSCDQCERKPWCVIKRHGLKANSYHQVQHEARLMEETDEYRQRRRERMWKMEGLFAEGKSFHGLERARYRGRAKVQIQVYLIASVQNLKRLMAVVLWFLGWILARGQKLRQNSEFGFRISNFLKMMPLVA